jgi:SPP1 gp7 family putative phage head morphogenesis protein
MGAGDVDRWAGCHGDVYALASDIERERAVSTVGKPEDLTAASMLAALPTWRAWQQEIATLVSGARDAGDAGAKLAAWADARSADETAASTLYTSAVQADMAGQLFVRAIEVPESLPARALDNSRPPAFLRMSFDEAVAAFLERRIVTPEEFRQLSDAAKQRAFTATRLGTETLRRRAYEGLLAALREGATLDEFAEALRTEEASLGVTPADPYYLETVFRTGVQTAYGAGRLRQIQSPVVQAARPFVQVRNPDDSRTTDICRTLNGLIFRQDDPGWTRFAPPSHFNCRSSVVTRRASDVDGRSVTLSSEVPAEGQPAPGFDGPPTVAL